MRLQLVMGTVNTSEKIFEEEYSRIIEFLNLYRKFLSISANLEGIFATIYATNSERLNQEIIDLSNKEKNLIFSAFLIQLIIFFIIQFFEISSVIPIKDKK